MSIKKPLGLGLLIGLMSMAFVALPAMASAAPSLTSPAKTLVPVKSTITATSTNATTVFPGVGTLTCKKAVVHGIVEKNSGTEVEVLMDGASDTATECNLSGTAVEVGVTFTSLKLTPTSKTATFDFTAPGVSEECTVTVTYTSGATKFKAEGPCTGTLSGTFSGEFTATVGSPAKAVIFD